MQFEFATANRILFGPGTAAQFPTWPPGWDSVLFVVTGSKERSSTLVDGLLASGLSVELFEVNGEPDLDCVLMGYAQFTKIWRTGCSWIRWWGRSGHWQGRCGLDD